MYSEPHIDEYKPLKTLALLTVIALAINGISNLLMIIPSLGLVVSPDHVLDLGDGDVFQTWMLMIALIFFFSLPVGIATIVLFLIWLYRAHKNLASLKPTHLQFTPGWAVGWWFVPFLNLVKPYQAVREVWWESDPDIPEDAGFLSASLHYAPTYVGVWWGFWIAANIISNIASRVFEPDRPELLAYSGVLFVVSSIITAIAAVLAIMVVRDITSRQSERYANVRKLQIHSQSPPPPPTFGDNQ